MTKKKGGPGANTKGVSVTAAENLLAGRRIRPQIAGPGLVFPAGLKSPEYIQDALSAGGEQISPNTEIMSW